MKAIAINGSPRLNGTTAKLLLKALEGTKSAGAETVMHNLYQLNYSGCRSCFACKRKRIANRCRCYLKDDLSPILDQILQSDVLLVGSPIYFNDVSGQMRSFLERLGFITLSYDSFDERTFSGEVSVAFFFTMNAKQSYLPNYEPMFNNNLFALKNLGGSLEYYACCNTVQFDDYSKYHAARFDVNNKLEYQQTQFPLDLESAYAIGYRLADRCLKKKGE